MPHTPRLFRIVANPTGLSPLSLLDDESVCRAIGDSPAALSDMAFALGATSVRHEQDLVADETRLYLKRVALARGDV